MADDTVYRIRATFIEPVLGSQPQRDIAEEHAMKRTGFEVPDDEEATLPEMLEKGTTAFHHNEAGEPIMYDYQWRGFLKKAGQVLNGRKGLPKACKAKVRDYLHVQQRAIPFNLPTDPRAHEKILAYCALHERESGKTPQEFIDIHSRPLRAQTPMGERVAIARSEELPPGVVVEFDLLSLDSVFTRKQIETLFDYGYHCGIGQRRGDGWGRFIYGIESVQVIHEDNSDA